MLTNIGIVDLIDEYIRKQEKEYLAPGEKPPKGEAIKVGPKGGKFYEPRKRVKTLEAVDKDILRRQYAAFKTRQKGKLMDEQEKKFVEDTLGKLNKLSTEDLKAYFKEQYAKVKSIRSMDFDKKFAEYNKKIDIKSFSELEKLIDKSRKERNYPLMLKLARELYMKFHPESKRLREWVGWVYKGSENYRKTGDDSLLDYAARKKYFTGWEGLDIQDKNEYIAKVLVGYPWSYDTISKKINMYETQLPKGGSMIDSYNRFTLALKPYKGIVVDNAEKIHNAFVKKDWKNARKILEKTKYGLSFSYGEYEKRFGSKK